MNNLSINRVNVVADLGIIPDSKCFFNLHVVNITNQALAELDFIKRTCKRFHVDLTLKLLYFTLVRSQIKYVSLIW